MVRLDSLAHFAVKVASHVLIAKAIISGACCSHSTATKLEQVVAVVVHFNKAVPPSI